MFKKYALLSLFSTLLFMPPVALSSIDLTKYNQLKQASASLSDKEIKSTLRGTLGEDYNAFVENFDVFGEPHQISDGGLFVEGWLNDLYLENASAFVIYPNGKVYAGWVTPDAQIIHYKTNDNDHREINPAIKAWAARFKEMSFTLAEDKRGKGSEVDYFTTDKFIIKVTTQCQPDGQCNDATYYGKRKKDGAELTLRGKASRAACDSGQCPIISYEFNNGQVAYMLSKVNNSLTIVSNNKFILDEKGEWSKEIKATADSNFTGRWEGEDAGQSTLNLSLTQTGNVLTGTYCYITQSGNRIDCPGDEEDNIHGVVKNGKAEIIFDSSFGGKDGQATLELDDAKMKWHLVKAPVKGNYYAPNNYDLTRQSLPAIP